MIISDIVRNENFTAGLTPYAPYIWLGHTTRWELPDAWPEAWESTLLEATGRKKKALAVSRDFLERYIQEDTYNDCAAQEGSFYFDRTSNLVYVHVEHDHTPIESVVDYGYGFGVSDTALVYIDDYEYLPLIESSPSVEESADAITSKKPTGIAGSVRLRNAALTNSVTGAIEGPLDWIISESIFGNDVYFYSFDNSVLSATMSAYIDGMSLDLEAITLELESRRFV